ncbi:hypothetical protein TRIATDRAFT_317432 [Trichoderma atroviride IMI 206040]|uniref:Uncharacterized protein n=1 Tax=Hypocrea atroviridis (strain ATCC 20476 / IMI 206040) TaxID=452589 RepID=G9NSQ0_HYPAI|nr:uncharacterized protein TRIATDRAFT_317432 [Trichoderma atroviride IMI 206040]EHK46445.1 hypothetical protein TRIATDRAFT_317432 [Trichoderma atroviride IMI 206040]
MESTTKMGLLTACSTGNTERSRNSMEATTSLLAAFVVGTRPFTSSGVDILHDLYVKTTLQYEVALLFV